VEQSVKIRVEAPASAHPMEIAEAIAGPHVLLKAEPVKYSERTFTLYRPLRELSAITQKIYEAQLDKMMREILKYIEKEVVMGSLDKADGPRSFLPSWLQHITGLIKDYHLAFIATTIGPDFLPKGELQRLIDSGILPQDMGFTYQPSPHELPPTPVDWVGESYDYGNVLGQAPGQRANAAIKAEDYPTFKKKKPPKLTEDELAARKWAQSSAATHVTGLGNTVADDFSTIAVEADSAQRKRFQSAIREELDSNIEHRKTWRELASELGHRTKDWARGFKRIAATEKQTAMQEGFVAGLIKREGDPDETYVAKQPAPDACPDCQRLHLINGVPKIFKLSVLIGNGTNVGKKRPAWQPVVGATHPWCGCEIVHVPSGWGFNEEGHMVPLSLRRSQLLAHDLRKSSNLTYTKIVPDKGCAIRVGDPVKRMLIEQVIAQTPPEIFDKRIGVTLITTDHPRVQNPLHDHDLAYWTGNEIRLSITLKPERVPHVVRHELGHSLNVYLMNQWGGVEPVREWHKKLDRVSKDEGYVSDYAKVAPIENAAEATRLYLYDRKVFMLNFPRTFAMLHKAYRAIWVQVDNETAG
jgi:hypothetical protein